MVNDINGKILILGARGNLGRQIVSCLREKEKRDIIEWTRDECNVMDLLAVENRIRKMKPDVVINTIAYNDVDACESILEEQKKAIILNIRLVDCLAYICKDINAQLIHFSTNYVFSGEKECYYEDDEASPINFYGMTKRLGEEAILSKIDDGLKGTIIRISNLFGPQGTGVSSKPSFFDSIIKASKTRDSLNIVNDEKCCFTYTKDIAETVYEILSYNTVDSIYHCANTNPLTWYDAAKKYFSLLNMSIQLNPVEGSEFHRSAKRPKTAVLYTNGNIKMRDFDSALVDYIQECNKILYKEQ